MLGDGIRRNIRTVSKEERDRLRDAILALHTTRRYPGSRGDTPAGGVTYWFKQDEIHAHTHVHGCPAFLPWHREMVNRFEALIREIDPQLSLHYWDWTEDPGWMFTSDFMGNASGEAGDPWLSAGFYVPGANPYRSDNEFDPNNNPYDPPRNLTRAVRSGAPFTASDDYHLIHDPLTFQDFDAAIQGPHATGHSWIGGTLSDPHTSFRDPVVFLLHSNIDRLFAMWQRVPGHPERLDSATVYGAYSNTQGSGDVATGHPNWGILSPLEPWAGPGAQTAATGIIANVQATRPWAPPENQEVYKDSKHPSVVRPPSYDTQPHSSYIILDRSTFSSYEVQATPSFPAAFTVIFDGFAPNELGTPISAPGITLTFDSSSGPPVGGIAATVQPPLLEDPGGAVDVPQRITFAVDLQFTDPAIFDSFGETRLVYVQATHGSDTSLAVLELIKQPSPYMVDGPITWLSTDVRVFQIRENDSRAGVQQHAIGSDPNAPFSFIQDFLNLCNTTPDGASHPFRQISEDQQVSSLELSQTVAGVNVYNYAVVRVRYRANSVPANDVQVFFRVFSTMLSALDYSTGPSSNYARTVIGGRGIPLLGVIDGEVASMPFFATPRVDTGSASMMSQPDDAPNRHSILATGDEVEWYFGCWLDINQPEPRFPLSPVGSGPYTGRLSIPQLIRGHHQCLVAEIFYQPGGVDPIPAGSTPASSDRLAQRNLAIVESDNPGDPSTHTVQHTFMVKPSIVEEPPRLKEAAPAARGPGDGGQQPAAEVQRVAADELMIRWNDLPRDTVVTLYVPEWDIDEVIALSALRQHPAVLSKVDAHTLSCKVAGVAFIPIPGGAIKDYAALISLTLPPGVRDGQHFTIDVLQASRMRHRFLGSFRLSIPVRQGRALLDREIRKLAVLRYIGEAIPATNRWAPVFRRYIDGVAGKVLGLGGDPTGVPASLQDPNTGRHGDHRGHPCVTGKVALVLYDCFGEFEGFVVADCDGEHHFATCEKGIEAVVRYAGGACVPVRVCTERHRICHVVLEYRAARRTR